MQKPRSTLDKTSLENYLTENAQSLLLLGSGKATYSTTQGPKANLFSFYLQNAGLRTVRVVGVVVGVEGSSLPFSFYWMSPRSNYQQTYFGSIKSLRGGGGIQNVKSTSASLRLYKFTSAGLGSSWFQIRYMFVFEQSLFLFSLLLCLEVSWAECQLMRSVRLDMCLTEEATPAQVLFLCGVSHLKHASYVRIYCPQFFHV